MKFRIEIPDRVMREHSSSSWGRMVNELWGESEVYGHQDLKNDKWIYTGDAPSKVVNLLAAAARGDDLNKVIDLMEVRGVNA